MFDGKRPAMMRRDSCPLKDRLFISDIVMISWNIGIACLEISRKHYMYKVLQRMHGTTILDVGE